MVRADGSMRTSVRSAIFEAAWRSGPPVVLAIATVLALWLGFNQINARSFWLDEATTYFVSGVSWTRLFEIFGGAEHGWHPPTYFVLLKLWRSVAGDGQADLRAFSLVFSVASVPATYFLVRLISSAWPAAVAALLIACNAFVVRYAQEARTYTLTMFLSIVATTLVVWAIEKRSRWAWAAYAVVAVLGVYAQLFFGLVVAAHFAAVALERLPRRDLWVPGVAFAAIGLLSAPLLIASLFDSQNLLGWVRPIEWDSFQRLAIRTTGGTSAVLVAYGVGAFLALSWLLAGPGRGWRWTALIVLWLVIPVAGLALLSLIKPLFVIRYTIVALPALIVLAAVGVANLPRWAAIAVAPVLLITSLFGVTDWYSTRHPEYRQIARHISADSTANGGVLIWRSTMQKPIAYQIVRLPPGHTPPALLNPPRPWDWNQYSPEPDPVTDAQERLADCEMEQLWLVGGPRALDRWVDARNVAIPQEAYSHTETTDFGGLKVHRYERNDAPCPP